MVVMAFSAHVPTAVTQERVALPSIKTVHAPHRPSPQPYLLPVRSRSSRRTLSRLRSESAVMERWAPLTSICLTVGMIAPPDVIHGGTEDSLVYATEDENCVKEIRFAATRDVW